MKVYSFDPIGQEARNKKREKPEMVTLDTIVESSTSDRMKFATTMDTVVAISALEPTDESTLVGVVLDSVGFEVEQVPVEGEEGVTEDNIVFDEDAVTYALGVTLDFISTLGVSDTAIDDLMSSDVDIARDELQQVASLINETTADSIDIPSLVSMAMDKDMIAEAMQNEEATFDSIVATDLKDVTLDWAFSKGGKPEARANGHVMKVVKCTRRGEDGKVSNGYCRYPQSLLKGKYKKSKKRPSKDQQVHLDLLKQSPRDKQWRNRISQSLKLKRKSKAKA